MSLETGRDTSMDGQDSVGKSGVQSVQRAVRLLEVLAAARVLRRCSRSLTNSAAAPARRTGSR